MGWVLRSSAVVRSPDLSIKSRLRVYTGFGPSSSAVGIFEPVTITRSTSTAGVGEGVGSCANAVEARGQQMIAPLEAAHEINKPLNKSSLSKSSAVYQISRGLTRHYPRHLRFRQKIQIFRVISGQISCST